METEDKFMMRALALAARGVGHTRPNPPVGAVIVKKGLVIGEGWHRRCGGDHAEVAAIKSCACSTAGATIYVTLEPCSKAGRVGACTDAITAARIRRVVYLCPDPNPINRGKARRALSKAGVACERFRGDRRVRVAGERLIAPFAKHVTTGLPFVTVKLAMSLDGRICDVNGDARWISSAAARKRTGLLRESVDAIMVGAQTVRKDDPSLLSHGRRNDDLVRVVVSSTGKLPAKSKILTDGRNSTVVFDDAERAIRELGRMGLMHVLCEGGLELARSLADAGLVDEWIAVLSPKVLGNRPIGKALSFHPVSYESVVAGDQLLTFGV